MGEANRTPFDGSVHAYLGRWSTTTVTFPVQGLATFYDTFYAARGSGQHHAQDLMSKKLIPVVAARFGHRAVRQLFP